LLCLHIEANPENHDTRKGKSKDRILSHNREITKNEPNRFLRQADYWTDDDNVDQSGPIVSGGGHLLADLFRGRCPSVFQDFDDGVGEMMVTTTKPPTPADVSNALKLEPKNSAAQGMKQALASRSQSLP
jgi:hypothetical protein